MTSSAAIVRTQAGSDLPSPEILHLKKILERLLLESIYFHSDKKGNEAQLYFSLANSRDFTVWRLLHIQAKTTEDFLLALNIEYSTLLKSGDTIKNSVIAQIIKTCINKCKQLTQVTLPATNLTRLKIRCSEKFLHYIGSIECSTVYKIGRLFDSNPHLDAFKIAAALAEQCRWCLSNNELISLFDSMAAQMNSKIHPDLIFVIKEVMEEIGRYITKECFHLHKKKFKATPPALDSIFYHANLSNACENRRKIFAFHSSLLLNHITECETRFAPCLLTNDDLIKKLHIARWFLYEFLHCTKPNELDDLINKTFEKLGKDDPLREIIWNLRCTYKDHLRIVNGYQPLGRY